MLPVKSIYDLPDDELRGAFDQALHYVIDRLNEDGASYSTLAQEFGIGVSALKQFVRRGKADNKSAINRGRAFDCIYIHMNKEEGFSGRQSFHAPSDALKSLTYSPLLKMLKVKRESMSIAETKIFRNEFICVRLSSLSNYLMISHIYFKKVGIVDEMPIYEFHHYYKDGDGVDKKSDGVTFVLHKNVYLFGDIQNGEGIDSFVINEPVGISDFVIGFINSIDDQHRPFFSKVILFNLGKFESRIQDYNISNEDSFHVEDFIGLMRKEELKDCPIINRRELAENIIKQLTIKESETYLNITRDYPLIMN